MSPRGAGGRIGGVPGRATILLLLIPFSLEAQGYRGSFRTYLNYVDFRQAVVDSVPMESVPGEGPTRVLPDGTPVVCGSGHCRYYRSGDELGVIPLMEDLELNLWPGVKGLRGYVHLRARQSLGDNNLWPRYDKSFEVLAAYAEYSGQAVRVQGGRLWKTGSLGFYNFDGADLLIRLPTRLQVEAYGGLALVRGLNERHTGDLLTTAEPLGPQEDAWVLGAQARWRPSRWLSAAATYQREAPRGGVEDAIYSERLAGNLRLLLFRASLELDAKYDLASREINEARARLLAPLGARLTGTAEVRRYRPFFPLWSIWGVFSPVGFDEARVGATWSAEGGRLSTHVFGGYRSYRETHAGSPTSPVRDDGWRVQAGGAFKPSQDWTVAGDYQIEVGYGASRSSVDLSLTRALDGGGHVAARGTVFRRLSEFQVGEGTGFGVGADAGYDLSAVTLTGGAMIYRHSFGDRPQYLDWNQLRAHLTLEVPIGDEPGMESRRER